MNETHPYGAVVRVGDARGFVVEVEDARFVITAAHCLPRFPPCYGASGLEDRTYAKLLGRLNEPSNVSAECVFVDPIADIALLGCPDNQAMPDQADGFIALTTEALALGIRDAPDDCIAWLLTLDGRWARCRVQRSGGWQIWIRDAIEGIHGGMSGSPICDDDGLAIGVCCVGIGAAGGPNPSLTCNLPVWWLRMIVE